MVLYSIVIYLCYLWRKVLKGEACVTMLTFELQDADGLIQKKAYKVLSVILRVCF